MTKHSILKVVCAWCGADMGEKDGHGIEGTSVARVILPSSDCKSSDASEIASGGDLCEKVKGCSE